MAQQNNSTEIIKDEYLRLNVDIGRHKVAIEKAATEDSYTNEVLYTIPEYTREIILQFLYIREYCRQNDLPLYRPVDIADAIISGDITINTTPK
jgi:hypothetical protein